MRSAWRVIDYGDVPTTTPSRIDYACPGCGVESELPVKGLALAQIETGVVFDRGDYAMPRQIQCRHCRRRYELDVPEPTPTAA